MRLPLLLAGSLVVAALAPTALRAQDATSAAFNAEVQGVWDRLRPQAEAEVRRQAAAQVGPVVREPKLEVDLTALHKVELDLARAPGLTSFHQGSLSLRVPRDGAWRVAVEGDVEVRFRFLWGWRKVRLPVRIEVREVSVEAHALFDWTDPNRPKIARVDRPDVAFKVRLRSPGNLFADVLLRVLTPVGKLLAKRALSQALDDLMTQVGALSAALPGPIPGDGAPLLTDSGAAVPVGAIAAGVDRKIRAQHLPNGIILPRRMDVPAYETWEQAYGPGGTGNPGTPSPHGDGGDSSAWNGHYMASQAFRYAVSGEPEALDNVRTCLQAFHDMLTLNGGTGLMARVAAPEGSPMGQVIVAHNDPARIVRGMIRGQTWVATNGNQGASRDVYIEISSALAVVCQVVTEPQVRADAARALTMMVDYLCRHGWLIDEDRPTFDPQQAARTAPTFWLGVPSQKLAMLAVASRLDPPRFAAEAQRWAPLSAMVWLSQWTGTTSLDDYFGYNLAHVTYYTAFHWETDPAKWVDFARGYHLLRRYVGHHRNAYFDAIHLANDPADTAYRGSVVECLRRFVKRPHRKVAPANLDLSGITWTTVNFPTAAVNPAGPPPSLTIPSEPLSPELRAPEDDFIWQRSPFSPYPGAGQGDAYIESTGLDLIAPYWLARYAGVSFP